ncbi:MAG TPA: DNA ligase D [Puia sp.]
MTLTTYKKKRSFSKTPEPQGGQADSSRLQFVVQKHDASHLHYDFRLEMGGVLKSWAVPKGPSMDPSVKRLAMMVEDHPYDYKNFEGIIPRGQYGGGTVLIWDEGNYEPVEEGTKGKKLMEKNVLQQIRKGKIHFILHGTRLKGEFALVRTSHMGEKAWLLMKIKDGFAKTSDITKKEKSVVSGKTLKQMESTSTHIFNEKDKKKAKGKIVKNNHQVKNRFPSTLSPMLATLIDKPFDQAGWLYEIKWDGYRCLAFLHDGKVELRSRNNKTFNEKFYPIYNALKAFSANAILDGEIVVVDESGKSNFGNLQNWRSEADGALRFYVFDLLWLNGKSLLKLTLPERKQRLEEWLPDDPLIQLSKSFTASGLAFFEEAKKMGLEGIMAKKMDSLYVPGFRSKEWLKIKIGKRQEAVIGGYTLNEGSPKAFSSLLAGVYKKGRFTYMGKIGTGFSDKDQKVMMKLFKPLRVKKSPFNELPDINSPSRFRPNPPTAKATWLKPVLVCEVSFTEMTADGLMRHPSFQGMRTDKKSKEVKEEISEPAERMVKNGLLIKEKYMTKTSGQPRKTLLNPSEDTQEKSIEKHSLKFTNLSKMYWPVEKITKRDLLNYYYQVAPFIIPYIKDRPQSLNRFPNGINGKAFYQKDVLGKVPDWVKTFPYHSEGDNRDKEFLVCTGESSLLYMVSLGCIEINPWSSRIQSPDKPDWCIIDLDPDNNPFNQVIETARVTHQILENFGVSAYCKTSGSTGLHIYIPLAANYTYDQSKEFARLLVTLVNQELPKITSIERATKNRKGKIYLDFLQNRPQATLAAPYSVRPKPGATVSMPLHWEELKKGLTMKAFTIKNAMKRIHEEGDIFKEVLGKGIGIQKILKIIEKQTE